MRPRIPSKVLMQVSVGSTLVVLAAILIYLGTSGRPTPARPGSQSQASRPAPAATVPAAPRPAPAAPQAPGTAGAPPSSGTPGAQTPASGKPPAGAPPAGTQAPAAGTGQPVPSTKPGAGPSPAQPVTPGAGQPSPATKPGGQPSPTPGTAGAPGSAAPAGPAAAAPPTTPRDREAAFVGTGQQGRNDPFSPLVSPESQRASPAPLLPPPPGVGLPMPPGFAAPGTPGATAPPSPGAGMRVTGIMGSRTRVAIIEAEGKTHIVGVGERVGDAVVVQILPEKVIMRQHNVTFELGVGGDRSS